MDDTATIIALTELVSKYPDITMTTVTDVLQACDHDPTRAYDMICEMVIPPDEERPPLLTSTTTEALPETSPTSTTSTSATSIKHSPPRAPRPVTYASADDSFSDPATVTSAPTVPGTGPMGTTPSAPRGAWATANMGRRYRVDQLCTRYAWLSPQVADALFDKYGDCIELVEADVLEMFPVDEPAAFAGGDGSSHHLQSPSHLSLTSANATAHPDVPTMHASAAGVTIPHSHTIQVAQQPSQTSCTTDETTTPLRLRQSTKAARIADALREGDEREIRRAARAGISGVTDGAAGGSDRYHEVRNGGRRGNGRGSSGAGPGVDHSKRPMKQLRHELWEKREILTRANALASQTRQPRHVSDAKKVSEELSRLSAYLLDRIRASDEYRDGCIDLHGLTRDEAIELVESKLEDGGRRRFRVITGKGMHSQNGQAVLRPALEKYLQRRGVKHSQYADGIMTVIP